MKTSKILGLFSCALVLGSVACGGSEKTGEAAPVSAPTAEKTAAVTVQGAHSFSAKASTKTTQATGITKWHVLTEKAAGAVVIEGANASGKVVFSTTMRPDGKSHAITIDSYRTAPGHLTLAREGADYVLSNTIQMDVWTRHMRAFQADWEHGSASVEFSVAGDLARGAAKVVRATGTVANYVWPITSWVKNKVQDFSVRGVKIPAKTIAKWVDKATKAAALGAEPLAAALEQMGKELDAIFDEGKDPNAEPESTDESEDPNADPEDPNADPEDPNADPEDPNADPEDPNAEPEDPNAEPEDPNAEPEDPNAEPMTDPLEGDDATADFDDASAEDSGEVADDGELTADESDENLDEGGGDEVDEGGGDEVDEGGGDEGSADEGSADEGGGDAPEEEFASHGKKGCRHLSCSKSSKVCVCTRY